ncbi:AtpZ/AtpI family protein [Thermosipho ferrireducens]|uniref:AtpZ/AtpI family protein n=1 Tax=Thermosipho ferrireducens TaxID=2571116 RepID=A0ABX7S442_9BACT|nr:AtpZ/AtpI family protein [Thermosipho ferrireducens]QTA37177.1 AtpZ/AtpI family protein [Thermosipho ferrireducens]
MNKKSKNLGKELLKLNLITIFGASVAGNIIVGFFIGKLLDHLFKTEKIFVIIFLFLGAISGIYNGIRQLLKEVEKYDK